MQVAALEAEVWHLGATLSGRPSVERAVGMLMMLMPCRADQAVIALEQISQHTNRPLEDVAEQITARASISTPLPADVRDALVDVLPLHPRLVSLA